MNKLMIPVVLACVAFSAQGAIRLSNLFSDRVVLQRANPMGDCNLYNAAGLPASPFRTDGW